MRPVQADCPATKHYDAVGPWTSYEDPQSMRLKREYVAALNLAGAMFWELSNDDGTLLDARRSGLGLSAPPIR